MALNHVKGQIEDKELREKILSLLHGMKHIDAVYLLEDIKGSLSGLSVIEVPKVPYKSAHYQETQ